MDTITTRGRELIAAAVTWRDEGISVVPVQPRSKAVWLQWHRYESNPPSRDLIQHWFSSGVMNLAVICGTGGLQVLDFDDLAQFARWRSAAGDLGLTYSESTGRGIHVFYQVEKPITRRFSECEAFGLDDQGRGHLCTVYPSVHPSGSLYLPMGDPITPIIRTKASKIFSLLSEPVTKLEPDEARAALNKDKSRGAVQGNDLISKIKAAFPLLSYAGTLTRLRPCGGAGRYLNGLCPFHEDTQPSFTVDVLRGLWRCYSPSCRGSAGGDVLNLYALANSITVNEAIKRLAREVL